MSQSQPASPTTCAFVRADGSRCPGPLEVGKGPLCFWHDPDAKKDDPETRKRLEEWTASGQSMEGFVLRFARLEGARFLLNRDLRRANLFRASLQGASMFNTDLREAQLLKANLAGANLNEARLEEADLLGANLDGTRLERVSWGECCINERLARQALQEGRGSDARAKFEEAEEIYRTLRQAYDGAGRSAQAGDFFRHEMEMRRMLLPLWSAGRAWSKLVDLLCAYGESPPRIIVSAASLNLFMSFTFFFLGVNTPSGPLRFDTGLGLLDNVYGYFTCLYYSLITFLTVGYGDILPTTLLTRLLAAAHAFVGAFMMALFVAVFGKRMTRG